MAYVRSLSGAASEKFPQNNASMQDLAFSYRMSAEVTPYGLNYDASLANPLMANLQNNLHNVRLTFRWPLRSKGQVGQGGQSYRTLVGGILQETNEPGFLRSSPSASSPYDLYFFQPRTYVKAP